MASLCNGVYICICTYVYGMVHLFYRNSEPASLSIINFNANSGCTSSAMDQKTTRWGLEMRA